MLKADKLKLVFKGPVKVCAVLALAAFGACLVVNVGAPGKSALADKRKELERIREDVKAIKAIRALTNVSVSEAEIRDEKNFISFLEGTAKTVGFRSRLKRITPMRKAVDAKTERAIFHITLPDVSLKEAIAFMYEIQVKKPYVNITRMRLTAYRQSQLVGLWKGTITLEFYAPRKGAESAEAG